MNILFICNGNVARSQEAALYFNTLEVGLDNARSAGVNPIIGKPIEPLVIQVLAEDGISMEGCYRKQLTPEMVATAGRVISFMEIEKLPDFARSHRDISFWNVPDPRHQDINFHRQVRDAVKERVKNLLDEMRN